METRQYWTCSTCGGGYFAGERHKVHATFAGLFCRMCHPFLAGSGGAGSLPDPLPRTGRMVKAKPPRDGVAAAPGQAGEGPRAEEPVLAAPRARQRAIHDDEAAIVAAQERIARRAAQAPKCIYCHEPIRNDNDIRRKVGWLHEGQCARRWDIEQASARAGVP